MWLCVYCLIHTKNPTFLSQFCICTIQNVTNFDRNVSTLWKPEEDMAWVCTIRLFGKHYESSLKFGCPCATLRLTRSPSRLATKVCPFASSTREVGATYVPRASYHGLLPSPQHRAILLSLGEDERVSQATLINKHTHTHTHTQNLYPYIWNPIYPHVFLQLTFLQIPSPIINMPVKH